VALEFQTPLVTPWVPGLPRDVYVSIHADIGMPCMHACTESEIHTRQRQAAHTDSRNPKSQSQNNQGQPAQQATTQTYTVHTAHRSFSVGCLFAHSADVSSLRFVSGWRVGRSPTAGWPLGPVAQHRSVVLCEALQQLSST
jgi:hypothetical protein